MRGEWRSFCLAETQTIEKNDDEVSILVLVVRGPAAVKDDDYI